MQIVPIQTPAELSPDMMGSMADTVMTEHIATARTARQNLVKVTSVEALTQVDKNHHWNLPASVSQINVCGNLKVGHFLGNGSRKVGHFARRIRSSFESNSPTSESVSKTD